MVGPSILAVPLQGHWVLLEIGQHVAQELNSPAVNRPDELNPSISKQDSLEPVIPVEIWINVPLVTTNGFTHRDILNISLPE